MKKIFLITILFSVYFNAQALFLNNIVLKYQFTEAVAIITAILHKNKSVKNITIPFVLTAMATDMIFSDLSKKFYDDIDKFGKADLMDMFVRVGQNPSELVNVQKFLLNEMGSICKNNGLEVLALSYLYTINTIMLLGLIVDKVIKKDCKTKKVVNKIAIFAKWYSLLTASVLILRSCIPDFKESCDNII